MNIQIAVEKMNHWHVLFCMDEITFREFEDQINGFYHEFCVVNRWNSHDREQLSLLIDVYLDAAMYRENWRENG